MSITLSTSRSSRIEPVRKNRWIFQCERVPGIADQSAAAETLAFAAHTCGIPTFTTSITEQTRIHEKFKSAGRPEWVPVEVSFYDYISEGAKSAGQILYNWRTYMYNPITGQMGYKKHYTTTSTLAQLDPMGAIFRMWNMFYSWPNDVKLGDGLDYSSEDAENVTAAFVYDYAIKSDDVDPSDDALPIGISI